MANELLSMAFETIDLSNMAWMVTNGVEKLNENQRKLAEATNEIVKGFPENLDFVDNVTKFQPLGLRNKGKSHKSSLDKLRLVELAKKLKNIAVENNSKELILRANKILKTLEICNSYIKDREFFENRTAALDSSNPYGRFMA
jgi:hypothetical protein